MEAIRRQARKAGFLYVLVALTAPVSLVYVPGTLFVSGDAHATAEHLRASEPLLRLGIAAELFHQAVEVFLVLVLYALFKPVSRPLTRQMAVLGLIPIPIMFVNVLNEIAALWLMRGTDFLGVIAEPQREALGMLFVRLHGQGIQVAAVFWGLWLIPLGLMIVRCRFIPMFVGVLAIAAGAGYVLGAFASLVVPSFVSPLGDIAGVLEIGELPLIGWLAIWGAQEPRTAIASDRP